MQRQGQSPKEDGSSAYILSANIDRRQPAFAIPGSRPLVDPTGISRQDNVNLR
jgi:hypothetical protein